MAKAKQIMAVKRICELLHSVGVNIGRKRIEELPVESRNYLAEWVYYRANRNEKNPWPNRDLPKIIDAYYRLKALRKTGASRYTTCRASECFEEIETHLFMCGRHWWKVMWSNKEKLWKAYNKGEFHDLNLTADYCRAAILCISDVAEQEGYDADIEFYEQGLSDLSNKPLSGTINNDSWLPD